MAQFPVGGNVYSCSKMAARDQFHIMRRLLASGGPLIKAIVESGMMNKKQEDDFQFEVLIPAIMEAVGQISDENADYIMDKCLTGVQRQESGGWQYIRTAQGAMMYQDIELPEQLMICAEVIKENLGNFFNALQRLAMVDQSPK